MICFRSRSCFQVIDDLPSVLPMTAVLSSTLIRGDMHHVSQEYTFLVEIDIATSPSFNFGSFDACPLS